MLRIKLTWRSWMRHLSLRSLGGVAGTLLLLGTGAVQAQQGTIVIQRGPKPAATAALAQVPPSAQPVAPTTAPASSTLPEPFTPPGPGQFSAFPAPLAAPSPAVPAGLLNLVPPSTDAAAPAATLKLVPPPMPVGWINNAPADNPAPMPKPAPHPSAEPAMPVAVPVTTPDVRKEGSPLVKASVDPQPTLDLIGRRTRLLVPTAAPQRVPVSKEVPLVSGAALIEASDLDFYLTGHRQGQNGVSHGSARLDPAQLQRLQHCEDLLIAGPQGYSNGRD